MLRFSLTAVLSVLFLVPPASAAGPTAPIEAIKNGFLAGQRAVPGGQLLMARVESAGKIPAFGFYFLLGGNLWEVEVDFAGKVTKKLNSGDPNQLKDISKDVLQLLQKKGARSKLPPGRLMEIAADSLKNTPLSVVKYGIQDGKLVLQIGSLVLDAETGQIIK
jgi:hypothetical protein